MSESMDKSRFIDLAPQYYALAIITHLDRIGGGPSSDAAIKSAFNVDDGSGDPDDSYSLLEHTEIFDSAINWLVEQDLISAVEDAFGPTIYRTTSQHYSLLSVLRQNPDLPFGKFADLSDGDVWLNNALLKVNREFVELGLTPADFLHPHNEWQPLPLDRSEPALQQTIDALDRVVDELRADNEYAVAVPEERSYVLAGLASAQTELTQAPVTSLPFLKRYLFHPVGLLYRRFRSGTLSVALEALKGTIVDFLKEHGIDFLDSWLD